MIVNAFTMKLKEGNKEEYQRRHDALWPELSAALRASGILFYSIFLEEATGTLFAFQQLTEDNTTDSLASLPIMQKWWASMKDLMETNPDNSPVAVPLQEVFRLEA
ncbi:MAG: L-rhamnose mutarotase [Candidatus Hydrogenedentes bacterium]|nr:L-rhamnose mutarotase [Candidatus Hydrogenedentota bacterium]